MNIIPAIDLIDGQNVRLKQGDYNQKSSMRRTPEEAVEFYSTFDQVTRIHVVDLMGALKQHSLESNLITRLKDRTSLPVQIGGGLRDTETIDKYNAAGIDYFILGTRAITDINWLKTVTEKYPDQIFVGIDAKEDDIYINGWTENSGITIDDYLTQIKDFPLAGVIYTDISKDGMGEGPNFKNTALINENTPHKVIASGGIRSAEDLDKLAAFGIDEAIVGKASHNDGFWEGIK